MKAQKVVIGKTLKEFLAQADHDGFKLAIGYYAELEHGCMGTFPAIERESEELVMTTDFELLKRVVATLQPRPFRFGTQLIYLNPKTGMAYSIVGTDEKALEKASPYQTLSLKRFQLLSKKPNSFQWAPGLVGPGMSVEEFTETLKAAVA